jgi:DNA-binding CsgD family transcriptional regulator
MTHRINSCCGKYFTDREFAGRRAELSQIEQIAAEVTAGRPRTVLVEGGEGVGKTALLRRGLAVLPDSCVLRASCDPAEAELPFGLISQLLWRARCHSELPVPAAMTPAGSPADVGTGLLEFIHAAHPIRPLAVFIDDLQWADPASTEAIGFVLRRLGSGRILTLLAARTGVSGNWTAGAAEDWRRLIGDAGRRISLHGLPATEVAELAQRLGHGPVPLAAAERLRAHTDGNPGHLRALLTGLPAESLTSPDRALPVPAPIAAQAGRLLSALPEPSSRLLAALAVLDTKCPLGLAAQIGNVADPVTALEPLLDSGIVQWWPEDPATPVRVRQPVQRDAIYQALTPGRRRELHLATASLVHGDAAWGHRVAAAAGPDPELAGELEAAAACADNAARAATLLLWAADLSDGRPESERRLLAGAAYLVWCRRPDEALAARVAGCAPCPLRDLVLLAVLLALKPGDRAPEQVRALLASALAAGTAAVPGARKAEVRVALAIARGLAWRDAARRDDGETADDIVRQVLAVDGLDPDSARLARCLTAESAGWREGGVRGAARALEELCSEESGAAGPGAIAGWRRGALRVVTGELAGAAADLSAAVESAAGGLGEADASACVLLGYVQYLLGAWPAAAATAERAGAVALSRGVPRSYAQAHAVAACVAAGTGNWARAEEHLSASNRWWRTAGSPPDGICPALAEATIAQARGDHLGMLTALGPLTRPGDRPRPGWSRPLAAEALIGAGKLDAAAGELAVVAVLAADGAWPQIGYGWLAGWLARRQGDLHVARAAYEEALAIPVTPDDVPLLRARLEQAYGQLLLAQRSRRAAITWLRQAHERYTSLGAAPFAERCAADLTGCGLRGTNVAEQPTVLSHREHRVAHLVGSGMTNQEVASALFISTKTVEYHLSNIFLKLGITSRRQLRPAFGGDGAAQQLMPVAARLAMTAPALYADLGGDPMPLCVPPQGPEVPSGPWVRGGS